jgi:hypothetical protein
MFYVHLSKDWTLFILAKPHQNVLNFVLRSKIQELFLSGGHIFRKRDGPLTEVFLSESDQQLVISISQVAF